MSDSDDRARRVVLAMCPYVECSAADHCKQMGSVGDWRFCRLRPPLDEIARREPQWRPYEPCKEEP